jgi:hypothetical protein
MKRHRQAYSLHPDQINEKLRQQDGKCDICKKPLTYKETRVDHDHNTGNLRGILCAHCNWLLGHAKDNKKILQSAIEYLDKHKNNPVQWPQYKKPIKIKPKPFRSLSLGERVARMIKYPPGRYSSSASNKGPLTTT